MSDFKRDYKSGQGRDFNRDERPQMHKAVCSNCGKECEVPFMPSGSKPVYCSDCFEKNGGRDANRGGGRERDTRRPSYEDRPMFDAVCDNCGNDCKIPFQPRSGKPVYCNNCFDTVIGANPRKTEGRGTPQNDQIAALNAKLDKILALLSPNSSEVTPAVEEVVVENVEEKPAPKKRKAAVKKVTPSEEETLPVQENE